MTNTINLDSLPEKLIIWKVAARYSDTVVVTCFALLEEAISFIVQEHAREMERIEATDDEVEEYFPLIIAGQRSTAEWENGGASIDWQYLSTESVLTALRRTTDV